MDLIDRKIICELDMNCRTPLSRMAKKLRIGRNVLDYRIKKMEREGIITNYICSINLQRLGYKTYKIFCKMKSMTSQQEKEFTDFISSEKGTIHFIKTEGSFDYAFVIAVQRIGELDSFLSEMKARFKDVLSDYIVCIVVYSRIFKMNKLLLGERNTIVKFYKYGEDERRIELDDKNKKILKLLSREANMSLVELANRTGFTIDVVRYRLRELSRDMVSSFRIIADMSKIGYFHYVVMLKVRSASMEEEKELVNWCMGKRNVMFVTKRIGVFDFEINAAIKDLNDLNSFISEMKSRFGNIIDSYELIVNSRLLKLNYLPF